MWWTCRGSTGLPYHGGGQNYPAPCILERGKKRKYIYKINVKFILYIYYINFIYILHKYIYILLLIVLTILDDKCWLYQEAIPRSTVLQHVVINLCRVSGDGSRVLRGAQGPSVPQPHCCWEQRLLQTRSGSWWWALHGTEELCSPRRGLWLLEDEVSWEVGTCLTQRTEEKLG